MTNPDLADNLGKITADDYFNMTGKYPRGAKGSYGGGYLGGTGYYGGYTGYGYSGSSYGNERATSGPQEYDKYYYAGT